MIHKMKLVLSTLGATMLLAASASATETTTYTYDALGRLIQSKSTGTVNNGLQTDTVFDPAGNRANQTVTGSVNNSPPVRGVIVLPLNGYTVIPLT
jgi:YD repeat-containing protein